MAKEQTSILIFLDRKNDFCIRRLINSNLAPDSFLGLPFILKRNNTGAGDNKASTNVARLYINGKYKNIALVASGHITSSTSTSLKVTITANSNGTDAEIYTSSGTGSQDKDYSAVIPAGTEYIEITAYHGATGQQVSYEIRLNSLTVS